MIIAEQVYSTVYVD